MSEATERVRAMLDGICEVVEAGVAAGETRVHVTLAHEYQRAQGVSTEFLVVEGFRCSDPDCAKGEHVRVHAMGQMYEWPEHLEHRGDGG